jgi:hypothetical protein
MSSSKRSDTSTGSITGRLHGEITGDNAYVTPRRVRSHLLPSDSTRAGGDHPDRAVTKPGRFTYGQVKTALVGAWKVRVIGSGPYQNAGL